MAPFSQRICVLLLLLILGCQGQAENMRGCALNPTMDFASCRPSDDRISEIDDIFSDGNDEQVFEQGGNERGEGEDSGKVSKIQAMGDSYLRRKSNSWKDSDKMKVSFKVDDENKDKVVVHGTVCGLIPEYSSDTFYKCRNGVWTTVAPDLSDWTRTKRSSGYKLVSFKTCRRKCRGWWFWRRCWYTCATNYKRDYKPVITCPTIPDTYVDIRQTGQFMTWPSATARDQEDGIIRPRQVFGPRPNSFLRKGRYRVCYQVKDSQGSTSTCEVVFNIKVRTCPNQGQMTPYTFSSFIWFPKGNIFCSHNNTYGSVCTFSCDSDYEISGASKLECQANGQWTHDKPKCDLQKCSAPPSVLHGQWTACSRHTVGSQCTLACSMGYKVFGNIAITCQGSRTWTTPGMCGDSQVPDISCPGDISTFSLPKKQPVKVTWIRPTATDNSGDQVVITSSHQSGDLFPVGNTTVTYQARDPTGNIAVCSMNIEVKIKYCSSLTSQNEELISCSHGNAVGSECSFTCPEGYNLMGVSTRTCLDTQVWSNGQPSCEKKSCGSPPFVANGNFFCPDGHTYGATCTLACNRGHTPTSPLIITCEATSKWSAAGSCRDSQAPKFPNGCLDVSKFASIFGQPTYVMYPTPDVIDNSGGKVTVTVDITSGSEFQISSTNVTFTAVDFSGNIATCILTVTVIQIECPNPLNTDLDNSRDKVMRFSCPNGHVFGASCSISCFDQSGLAGSPTITCQQNGTSTGFWSYGNVKPFCNAKSCSEPEKPTYGALSCDVLLDREVCSVLCQEGHSFPKMDLQNGVFLCNRANGLWIPRPIDSDMCIPGRVASHVEIMPDIYCYRNGCSPDSDEIKRKFIDIINSTSIFSNICGSKNVSCVVDTVTVTCGARSRRSVDSGDFIDNWNPRSRRSIDVKNVQTSGQLLLRSKRSVGDATHLTSIAFTVKLSFDSKGNGSKTIEFYDDLTYDLNDHLNKATKAGEFDIPEAGEIYEHSYGFSHEEFECRPPTVFQSQSAMCVGCGQGYTFVSPKEPCAPCPVGTYQPDDEGTKCLPCPDGSSTKTSASKSVNDCIVGCGQGYTFVSPKEPCAPCPVGTYQPDDEGTKCLPCPDGSSTKTSASKSVNDCIGIECVGCGQGYTFVSPTEPCAPCPVGTYQPDDEGTKCLPCPDGSSTKTSASKSVNDCIAICLPGTHSKTGMQPCDRCRRGSYQAGTGKGNCDFCPYGMSTVSDGATSKDQCKFYQVKFNNASSHDYDIKEEQLFQFTFMAWVKSPTDLIDTETSFSLTGKPGDASFGCGDFIVYISVSKNPGNRKRRQWDHILMTFLENMVTLYVNGRVSGNKQVNTFCPDLIDFTSSAMLSELILSGIQISNKGLNQEEVAALSFSCNQILDGSILLSTENHLDSLITPSSCDDTDNCKNSPCGSKGVCVDLKDSYRCDCDDLWSGKNCGIEPDFCEGNQCENNAKCVSHTEAGNYTCSCTEDYRGSLCSERIVHGGWSNWSNWTQCSVTCGEGTHWHTRTCDNPIPGPDGKKCEGRNEEVEICSMGVCPVDGGLSEWTAWECSVTCGEGTSTRTRECNNPTPAYGGKDCAGDLLEAKDCENLQPCPINGAYGNFSEWSACSKSCGGGESTRERTCDSPKPQHGGNLCDPSLAKENRSCNEEDCPVCSSLIRPSKNVDSISCSDNVTQDMRECRIICKKGYITDEDKTYICGMATNYTWSHVTPDNPRGLLSNCEEATMPSSLDMKVSVAYPGEDLTTDIIVESVKDKLNKTLNCTNCTYKVRITNVSSRRKRAAESIETQVVLTVKMPNPDLDLRMATDEELDEQVNSLIDFEMAAQRLAEESNYIFTVSTNNKSIIPAQSSVRQQVDIGCPVGTESIDGFCANCGAGFYSISVDSPCQPCPKNFYQNNVKSTSCENCPAETKTAGLGARSIEECVEDPSIYYPDYIEDYMDPDIFNSESDEEEREEVNTDNDDADIGLIVGAVVGSVALVLIVIVGVIVYCRKFRKREDNHIYDEPDDVPESVQGDRDSQMGIRFGNQIYGQSDAQTHRDFFI